MNEAAQLATALHALRFIAAFTPGPEMDTYHRLLSQAGSFAAMQSVARETIAGIEGGRAKSHADSISNVIQSHH